MKKLSEILCTMAPWPFFWIGKWLALDAWGLAAAIASMAIVCGAGWHRMKGPDWTQLLFFVLVLAGLAVPSLAWAVKFQALLAPGLFVAMAFGSLLFRHPFTIPYAKEEVPVLFWKDPGFPLHFLRVNNILTCLWGLVFTVGLACAWLETVHALNLNWILHILPPAAFVLATILTRFFPLWYQKNYYEPLMHQTNLA